MTLEFLKKFPEIKMDELYQKLGILLANHFSACKRASTHRIISKQPVESVANEIQSRLNVTQNCDESIIAVNPILKTKKKKPNIPKVGIDQDSQS